MECAWPVLRSLDGDLSEPQKLSVGRATQAPGLDQLIANA